MAIEVKNVQFGYGDGLLLDDVSLSIKQGECVGIFGPNGGGKTTLLKLLMGFLRPQAGSLLIDGEVPAKKRLKMGYVPQISHLDRQFPITALEVVKMGGLQPVLFQKNRNEEAREMLKHVGLQDMAESRFGTLSGGQTQRVLIARALMGKPEFLFLDEATASVDPAAEKDFHDLLQKLKGTITIVMVTHDLPTESSYIDRFFCVLRTVTPYAPKEVCDHFAQGLYHPPLRRKHV